MQKWEDSGSGVDFWGCWPGARLLNLADLTFLHCLMNLLALTPF